MAHLSLNGGKSSVIHLFKRMHWRKVNIENGSTHYLFFTVDVIVSTRHLLLSWQTRHYYDTETYPQFQLCYFSGGHLSYIKRTREIVDFSAISLFDSCVYLYNYK